jgi:hypothetical protein
MANAAATVFVVHLDKLDLECDSSDRRNAGE